MGVIPSQIVTLFATISTDLVFHPSNGQACILFAQRWTIQGMNCDFATLKEHKNEELILDKRFAACRTVPGTQKLHSFILISTDTLELK